MWIGFEICYNLIVIKFTICVDLNAFQGFGINFGVIIQCHACIKFKPWGGDAHTCMYRIPCDVFIGHVLSLQLL